MSESPTTPEEPRIIVPEDGSGQQKLAEAYSELGEDLEKTADNRAEERFIWIVVCIILFDCFVFSQIENWAGAIVIGIIELVLIIALAKRLRVEEIAKLLGRFMDRVGDLPEKGGR